LRSAATVRAVVLDVVALLVSIHDAVAAVRGVDAARGAATVIAVVVDRPVVTFFGRLDDAVAAPTWQTARVRAIGIVCHNRFAFFPVVRLNLAVAAPGSQTAVGVAGSVGAVIDAVVARLRAIDDAVATVGAALAVCQAAAVAALGSVVVRLLEPSSHSSSN